MALGGCGSEGVRSEECRCECGCVGGRDVASATSRRRKRSREVACWLREGMRLNFSAALQRG